MNKAYLVALLVISAAMGFTLWSFKDSVTPYTNIQGARASETPVQVRGKILHDTAVYDYRAHTLRFRIRDDQNQQVEVVYRGEKPEAFDAAPETAAHGILRKDASGTEVFYSDQMTVKCPSKYDDKKSPYSKKATSGAVS